MNAFASALLCLTTHTPITTPAEFRSCECRIEVTRTIPPRPLSSMWGRDCNWSVGTETVTKPRPQVPGGHDGGGEQVDHDDHSEDSNRDPEKYEHWQETGEWPK